MRTNIVATRPSEIPSAASTTSVSTSGFVSSTMRRASSSISGGPAVR